MKPALILLAMLLSCPASGGSLWSQAEKARRDGEVVDLDPAARLEAQSLFMDLMAIAPSGQVPGDLRTRAKVLGLHLRIEDDRVLLWGADAIPHGFYAIRLGPAAPVILEAPHAFFDLETGNLTSAWFDEGWARAAFMNQGHRFGGPGKEPKPGGPDVAHRPASFYQAATLGAARGLRTPLVVQIHGFKERGNEAAVVSAGSALQTHHIETAFIEALAPLLRPQGLVLPAEQALDLAGRKNVQGRGLSGHARFVHLEFSRTTRTNL
ncbi:MAG: hypothetical protein VX519_05570, partial [Myxococcota bacterium]|nr:hypothetical protein [Myxococcota bacterium]